ncbi:hypothetical protein HYH03_013967 [Edaphochlamys debaryana]|uniref:MYND-type domain-containing protein n=1 Tax=Edaphochlamys debaryana TaxID=47281 RepID=A0A835XNN8_9CHLO|nr:hypothetical protein HYH03_013967 [Edaphochlamys debaryana]|eukprot:KAG2487398.1 hypothetical protein HYH03_013967 [Edaphochlamys debaryana]
MQATVAGISDCLRVYQESMLATEQAKLECQLSPRIDAMRNYDRRKRASDEAERALQELLAQTLSLVQGSGADASQALERWAEACSAAGIWTWLRSSLDIINSAARTMADAAASPETYRLAWLVTLALPGAQVLQAAVVPVHEYLSSSRTPQAAARALGTCVPFWQLDLLRPAAGALRGYLGLTMQHEQQLRMGGLGPDRVAFTCAVLASVLSSYLNSGLQCLMSLACSSSPAQLLETLAASGLLPAVAAAVLQCPGPDPDRLRDVSNSTDAQQAQAHATQLLTSADTLLQALTCAHHALPRAAASGGAAAARAADRLAAQLAHPDVVALQEALVERLLVHGGIELKQAGVQGGAQGRWWLTAAEAHLGQAISSDGEAVSCPGDLGMLADQHGEMLFLLASWLYKPPGPPQVAREVSRLRLAACEPWALEALCRLCRGHGLEMGGAYRPSADRMYATESAASLRPSGWGPCAALVGMCHESSCTPYSLGASSRAHLLAQVARAGLTASIDHALRLSFAAADRAALNPGNAPLERLATETSSTAYFVSGLLGSEALPARTLYGPYGGVLVNLSKRAAMLTGRLQDLEAEATEEARKEERTLLAAVTHRFLPALLTTQMLARAAQRRVGAKSSFTLHHAACVAVENSCLAGRLGFPGGTPLSTGQLLACQPHRLLAAACKLLCADVSAPTYVPPGNPIAATVDCRGRLAVLVELSLVALASIPELSPHVRSWLMPITDLGDGGGGGGGTMVEEAQASSLGPPTASERGCLEQLLRLGVMPRMFDLGTASSSLGASGCVVIGGTIILRMRRVDALALSLESELLAQNEESEWQRQGPAREGQVAALVAAPLPPPLPVPLAAAALLGVKMCAYPGCLSYGGGSEAGLPLRLCGDCRCVRYCGAACRNAHWRAGHKQECQAAKAAVAGAWAAAPA